MLAALRPNFAIHASSRTAVLYWIATSLLLLVFLFSIVVTFSDLEESYLRYAENGFPAWVAIFNGTAKILGVLAILHNRSRTLKDFAYAGFLFDLLLAFSTHLIQMESQIVLASVGLVAWVFAFIMDRLAFPREDRIRTRTQG